MSGALRRLGAAVRCDERLQYRQGFYFAAAFVMALWVLLLSPLSRERTEWLLPLVVLSNVLTNTFYFLAGLVLLEKREGTLEAQVVTPLRTGEYLASKLITLNALSLLENATIVALVLGPAFRPLPLLAGIVIAGAGFALCGFVAVARYDSVNEYLMPSIVYSAVLGLPFLGYLGFGDPRWFRLHPVQAPLELVRGALAELGPWSAVYALLYGVLWIGLAWHVSQRAFRRFILRAEGTPG